MAVRVLLLATALSVFGAAQEPSKPQGRRSGKFLSLDPDDLFQDLIEEIEDPLPRPTANLVSRGEHKTVNITPKPLTTAKPVKKETKPAIRAPEKIAAYNHNTGKFEMVAASVTEKTSSHHGKVEVVTAEFHPVTDKGALLLGGHPPDDSNKSQEMKVFWGSVGDAIESVPFLPIQVNVPDMISAMATFFSNAIPLVNSFQTPNQPRPHKPKTNKTKTPAELENRELKDNLVSKEILVKGSSPKRIFSRPKTTPKPAEPSEAFLKLFGTHINPPNENVKFKNMPFTRKKFHIKDREVFNFKNSDITNSPIMILNMPNRPIMFHKVNHQELGNKRRPTSPYENQINPDDIDPSVKKLKKRIVGLKEEMNRTLNTQTTKQKRRKTKNNKEKHKNTS